MGLLVKESSTGTFDFLIIGAGILGLTVAWELKKRHPQARIGVLEKEMGPGFHASGRNSGVLHSGIYYPKDTLKAQVCSRGGIMMRAFAKEYDIPCERRGKVIIPTSESELPTLDRLLQNAADNGIKAEYLDSEAIRKIEPFSNPYKKGIHIPDIHVIDGKAVTKRLYELLEKQGVQFYWNHKVITLDDRKQLIFSTQEKFSYGMLFNCAGAYADVIARKCGLAKDYALVPFKGIYYKLRKESSDLVRGNIYPVPNLSMPFLGVHLTRSIHGDVYIGPTSMPALGRENYGALQGARPGESLQILHNLIDLYVADNQNFRNLVHSEMQKFRKQPFLLAAQKLVPKITSQDMVKTSKSGIRPQLVNIKRRTLELDYVVEKTNSSIHVLNAISPAFTSSFEFAKFIIEQSSIF